MAYPTDLDVLQNPVVTDRQNNPSHIDQHTNANNAIEAIEAKLGIGAATPSSGKVLRSNGSGSSTWGAADLTADVTGTLPVANGGTGATTHTSGNYLLGAGTSAITNKTPANVAIELLPFIYPIGCIYFSTNSTNPATSLGFGTWSAFGAGRVPVGFDSGQTEFDTDEETGGANTHTLTTAEMPSHTHIQDAHTHTQDAHTHTQNSHTHAAATADFGLTDGSLNAAAGAATRGSGATNPSTAAATATNQNTTATNQSTTATNQNTGGGGAHNNLQPYIVVRMWKRTA